MKLKLSHLEQEALLNILENYDHLCDCPEFPYCEDFEMYQRLKKRIKELPDRSRKGRQGGVTGNIRMRRNLLDRGTVFP